MNISHIHYAVEVAHYGSFNKAANLFVSQPSLTRTDAYYIGLDLSNIRRGNREVCYVPIRDLDNSYTLVFLHLSQHALTPVEKELLSDVREIVSAAQKGGETAL